ncbi:MAG: high frequency lysogenization protein HflD [Gammaproteobacteria bacterium]|nr:high frequency lysogenization protein HflD [Gammaproteobacteria bacterium]
MSSYTERDRILALAAVFQAAYLVQTLAHEGTAETEAFHNSVGSILIFDADSTEDIFHGVDGLATGLQLVRDKLSGSDGASDMELTRYILSILQLEGRLARNEPILHKLQKGIDDVTRQAEYFAETHESDSYHSSVIAGLAHVYADTLSNLPPRIMVSGKFITDNEIANKIRTALLAGVRGAVLWRQVGGRRRQLIFGRKRYVEGARQMLKDMQAGGGVH